jgi:hypothetical protein
MSLPARQERVLGRIEHSLHADDPRLRSMFATFTKLTKGQQMPRLEQLESRSWPLRYWLRRLARPRRRRSTARGARPADPPGIRLRAILLVPIVLAALGAAVFLGIGGRSVSGCGPAARPQHSEPAPSRYGACLPVSQPLAYQRLPRG